MDPYNRIKQLEAELEAAQQEIRELSRDCVSGLVGRTTFEKHLAGTFEARRTNDRPMGVIMLDIDHFKKVNDEHGHRIGDEVINRVCRVIEATTRSSDLTARYGGEEFVVVSTDATLAGLAILSERIRRAVQQMNVEGLPRVTISVGFTVQSTDDQSGWDLVERADQNLYRAKKRGRNQVAHETLGREEVDMLMRIEMHQLVEHSHDPE